MGWEQTGGRRNPEESVPMVVGSSERAELKPKGGGWSQKKEVLKQGIGGWEQDFEDLRQEGDYQMMEW